MMHGMMGGAALWLVWTVISVLAVGGGVAWLIARRAAHRESLPGSESHGRTSGGELPAGRHGSFSQTVFRLAREHDGVLTVSDVVVETGLSPGEVSDRLQSLVDGEHVTMDVTDRGSMRYEFPELKRG